jgi:glycerophosphoryl diester phosphodiesterase
MRDFICFGHRGASGYEPENTLSSFERAITIGCPWVELDVHAVEDQLVVIHDANVSRTTNGRGHLSALTFRELRQLDAGKGQQVPTLREVIDLIDRRCGINVEIKQAGIAPLVNQALAEAVRSGWQPEQFLVSSFTHQEMDGVEPRFPRGALFDSRQDYCQTARAIGASTINLSRRLVGRQAVADAHDADLKLFVYTVNEPKDIDRMLGLGVDGVFSDFPDRVLERLGNRGHES